MIATERADWNQKSFRDDLWLTDETMRGVDRRTPTLIQLTQSGHDSRPQVVARRPLDRVPLRTQVLSQKDPDSDYDETTTTATKK